MNSIVQGFQYFIRAFKIINSDKEIKKLSFLPVFIFIITLTVGLVLGLFYIDDILNSFFSQYIESLNSYARILIYFVGFFVYSFAYYVLSLVFSSLLSLSICGVIAEKTLKNHTNTILPEKNFKESLFSFFSMLKATFIKMLLLIAIGCVLFICSFIPVLAPFCVFTSILLLCFDSMDFAFEKWNYGFKQRLLFISQNKGELVGFALGVSILVVIPFVQFIVLPLVVCGTTLLFAEKQTSASKSAPY